MKRYRIELLTQRDEVDGRYYNCRTIHLGNNLYLDSLFIF